MHTYYNIAEMILLIMQNHQRQKLVDVNFSFISLNLNNQTYTVVHFISISLDQKWDFIHFTRKRIPNENVSNNVICLFMNNSEAITKYR